MSKSELPPRSMLIETPGSPSREALNRRYFPESTLKDGSSLVTLRIRFLRGIRLPSPDPMLLIPCLCLVEHYNPEPVRFIRTQKLLFESEETPKYSSDRGLFGFTKPILPRVHQAYEFSWLLKPGQFSFSARLTFELGKRAGRPALYRIDLFDQSFQPSYAVD